MRRVLGLLLVLLVSFSASSYYLASILQVSSLEGYEVVDIEFYRELLRRILGIRGLDPDLKEYVMSILDIDVVNKYEEYAYKYQVYRIMEEAIKSLRRLGYPGGKVEFNELVIIADAYKELARRYGAGELLSRLEAVDRYVEENRFDRVNEVLSAVYSDIRVLIALDYVGSIESIIISSLERALYRDIGKSFRLRLGEIFSLYKSDVYESLEDILDEFISMNVSPDALIMVRRVKILYDWSHNIISDIYFIATLCDIYDVRDTTIRALERMVLNEIPTLERRVGILSSRLYYVEDGLGIELNYIRGMIEDAVSAMDDARAYVEDGEYIYGLRSTAYAAAILDEAWYLLNSYIRELFSYLVGVGEAGEYVAKEYIELNSWYKELYDEYVRYLNISSMVMFHITGTLLMSVEVSLSYVAGTLKLINKSITDDTYSHTDLQIFSVDKNLYYSRLSLNMLDVILLVIDDVEIKLYDKFSYVKDRLDNLSRFVEEVTIDWLYDAAVMKVRGYWRKFDDAYSYLVKGSIIDAGRGLGLLDRELDWFEKILRVAIEMGREAVLLEDWFGEFRDKYGDVVEIVPYLENISASLKDIRYWLNKAILEVSGWRLLRARNGINNVHNTLLYLEEILREKYIVYFYIVDDMGNRIDAGILFNNNLYLYGNATAVERGSYSIQWYTPLGGFEFVRWVVSGDATIGDEYSPYTTIYIYGNVTITLIVRHETGNL